MKFRAIFVICEAPPSLHRFRETLFKVQVLQPFVPGFASWPHHQLDEWIWARQFPSLSFSSLISLVDNNIHLPCRVFLKIILHNAFKVLSIKNVGFSCYCRQIQPIMTDAKTIRFFLSTAWRPLCLSSNSCHGYSKLQACAICYSLSILGLPALSPFSYHHHHPQHHAYSSLRQFLGIQQARDKPPTDSESYQQKNCFFHLSL